jgi:uncharacterized protein (DUF2147 family)
MTNRMLFLAAAFCVSVADGAAFAQVQDSSAGRVLINSPTGLWSTISDRDGKPMGVVEIREVNGELVGVVRRILIDAGPEDSVCDKCSDDRHGQPILGMEIIRHMKWTGDEWSGGEILDPEDGKTYRATLKLSDDGQKLIVRGYIGLPMFGRSQTWVRHQE